jgi:hypothetical protein
MAFTWSSSANPVGDGDGSWLGAEVVTMDLADGVPGTTEGDAEVEGPP